MTMWVRRRVLWISAENGVKYVTSTPSVSVGTRYSCHQMAASLVRTSSSLRGNILLSVRCYLKYDTRSGTCGPLNCNWRCCQFVSPVKTPLTPLRTYATLKSVNTDVANNVVLWKYDGGGRYFKLLNIFGVVQLIVFGSVSYTMSSFIPAREDGTSLKEYLKKAYMFLSFTVTPAVAGVGAAGLIWMFTTRSLKSIILNKGGKLVTLVKFHPIKGTIQITVPLEHITTKRSRDEMKSYLPLRVKHTAFYHLMDHGGKFVNPELFDYTVGLDRLTYPRK